MQGKKGIKRYTSPDLRQLVKARDEAFDQRERALSGILQVCAACQPRFCCGGEKEGHTYV